MDWHYDDEVTTAGGECWTRPDLDVGCFRFRGEDGEWGRWTIAHVEDKAPAGGSGYRYFDSLDDAMAAAIEACPDRPTLWAQLLWDGNGNPIEISGTDIEEMAAELAEYGDPSLSAKVVDAPGFTRGWIHGDGSWRVQ